MKHSDVERAAFIWHKVRATAEKVGHGKVFGLISDKDATAVIAKELRALRPRRFRDTERLDWLSRPKNYLALYTSLDGGFNRTAGTLRGAIDVAMRVRAKGRVRRSRRK